MRSDKATMVVTAVTTAVGTILVIVGIALLVLPGPGLLLIAAGLALLARNFTWAERLLHRARTAIERRRRRQRGGRTGHGRDRQRPVRSGGPAQDGLTSGPLQGEGDARSDGNGSVMPAA